MAWTPLFPADERDWLDSAVRQHTLGLVDQIGETKWNLSIDTGLGALALYFKNLNYYKPHSEWMRIVDTSLEMIERHERFDHVSFYSGGSGSLWLTRLFGAKSQLPKHKKNIARWIESEESCEFVRGLSGVGTGLMSDPAGTPLQKKILIKLMSLAKTREDGSVYWPITSRKRKRISRKARTVFDFGVAHGTAGIFLYQAFLFRRSPNLFYAEDRRKIENAVEHILKLDEENGKGFGFFSDDPAGVPVRSAWCYGDPGVGFALVQLGISFKKRAWVARGKSIALRGLSRSPKKAGVQDSSFCHGAIGLAHIAARLYQDTKDKKFKDQSERWYRIAIRLFKKNSKVNESIDGLLTGPLSFFQFAMAGTMKIDPSWDQMMLLSAGGRF